MTSTPRTARRTFWTAERDVVLADMWVAGSTMKEIAETLGAPTRGTVAGRLAKLGLLGKGGSGTRIAGTYTSPAARRAEDAEARGAVDRAFALVHQDDSDLHAEHRATLVLLAAIPARRSPHFAARYARVGLAEATSVLATAHEAGIWPEHCAPPIDRWSDRTTLRRDAISCAAGLDI